ncbi:MAG: CDGSH iron-sulfur domain-containing protein [Eubacteriaceae bacterium]|jgi:CDGSH-type Zn-finger protein
MSTDKKGKISCGSPAPGHPEQCHIPAGSKITPANQEAIDRIRAEFGIGPSRKTADPAAPSPAAAPETLDAAKVLKSLGVTASNPEDVTMNTEEVQSDPLGREEAANELLREKPALKKAAGIHIVSQGPYVVVGGVPLKNSMIRANDTGESVGWYVGESGTEGEDYALCRCGHSKHMPFCDGTHEKIQWDGTCTASTKPYAESARIYRGCNGYDLMDEESLCAIVRYCDPDGSCWNLVQKADGLAEAVIQTCNCVSGRLTVVKDGKMIEPELSMEIECIDDRPRNHYGPLWVKGGIPVKTADGVSYEVRNRTALCRCGHSANKPFCDGTHLCEADAQDGSEGAQNPQPVRKPGPGYKTSEH